MLNSYEKPTPIQAQAIPAIMSGRDMIGIAKTGSGKTLAFLIPMFRHVKDQPPLERDEGPIGIVMTPTRELAIQIHRECKKFCKALNLRTVCVYGGTGISEQIAELKRGAEIIVCTPGRMIDMLTANNGRVTNCRRCTYLVLDEADRMFDMGFEPQVMRIIDCIRPDRQTVMFSATFPRQMEALARRILDKPVEIQVGGRSVVCSDVDQNVVIVKNSGFSGKGFKFNEEENNKVTEAKKLQKWALGLQDSDDEAEAAEKEVEEIDKRLDAVFSKKPHIKKVVPVGNEAQIKGEQKAKLNLAASIAAKINQKISAGTNNLDPTQQAASQIIKGGTVTALTGLDLAKQLAEKIHSKLNYEGPQEEPKEQEQKEVETERYEDEVEINEFPQTARWKITSKDTIMAITEYSECAVTVRGTFFPPGKEPKEGERKIYLYIEGPSERAIQLAKVEIKRIVKEELVRLGTYRGPQQTGRYKVV
ncbi:probable ATP-dependent RNA helicase DDX46 [Exaiptasia diaphana]|uniref:Probable ATP-dependent RNA helicase DDX46 n=1 Tax=Exaiptasia diaphana TaxID=2652724 RepID=A0A913YX75_EXADI|nr:probable ATP-dependent RNA helicase DDX46 [Exaiptasia diaphana]